ncbi:MAG: hypothetical protein HQM14_12070 [SAR324 cluster bacterium]|nr:hypothetical protein [SAR324 cluster bacterium]
MNLKQFITQHFLSTRLRELILRIVGIFAIFCFMEAGGLYGYPIDGYPDTGIRRLERLRLRLAGQMQGALPMAGALKSTSSIILHLTENPISSFDQVFVPDALLQKRLDQLFPNRDESYSVALLDITPGKPFRFASRQEDRLFPPGSVGKLAIAAGVFAELARIHPNSSSVRQALLRNRRIIADHWIHSDHHEVPIYDPQTRIFEFRQIREGDEFSLYEWIDHMLSASANSAASTVWKEIILMRAFGQKYPPDRDEEKRFFKSTPRQQLQKLALSVVNDPLKESGIDSRHWQLGTFFTRSGKNIVPGAPSYASPKGALQYLIRLEQGKIVDDWSSLEIKKLMYLTEKRIRYASSPALSKAAVYFKSGSLYQCKPEPGFRCLKYHGNVKNAMNSVAIVETADGRVYLVSLMSDVLRKNSAVDHQTLATQIETIIKAP